MSKPHPLKIGGIFVGDKYASNSREGEIYGNTRCPSNTYTKKNFS